MTAKPRASARKPKFSMIDDGEPGPSWIVGADGVQVVPKIDDGVIRGRTVWNGPPGSGPAEIDEGEGEPAADGVIRKTRRDARVKPAGREPPAVPQAMTPTDRAVVWFETPPDLPREYEPQRAALVSFECMWAYQRALGSELTNAIGQVLAETVDEAKDEVIAKVEAENGRLRVEIAELKAKVSQLDFIVERLKVENRGPPGERGLQGRDGHEGRPGVPGPRGARGQKGSHVVSWEYDLANYRAIPIFAGRADGMGDAPGPALHLEQFFDRAFAEWEEAEDTAEADAEVSRYVQERADTEMAAWRVRNGLPAK
jgi:hypothetical protein